MIFLGNENTSRKITVTAASKAEMDRYKQVKAQQRKIQKTLLERVEKLLFEQFGTTAEERETAVKAKRGRQFRKKPQDKNLSDKKNTDETNTPLARVVLLDVLCSPVTGPLVLITL